MATTDNPDSADLQSVPTKYIYKVRNRKKQIGLDTVTSIKKISE
jgi:hypothetical protein